MRKRNCNNLFDNIMWYFIYLLPFIFACFMYTSDESLHLIYEHLGYIPTTLGGILFDILYDMGISIEAGTVGGAFYDVLGYFGTTGNETWLAAYLAYFVIVYCSHLMVDFVLFIPRLAHKWMKDYKQGD